MTRQRQQRPTIVLAKRKQLPKTKVKKNSPSALGMAIRGLGSLGGGALGGYLGNPVLGASAGNQLGALASKWLGFGDYAVSSNSVVTKASTSIPSMHRAEQSITVAHKEYVGVITSSQNFKVQYELPLNPGMEYTFPWLADISARFQEYSFKGVVFHYIPSSGTAVAGTNPALGSVMLQTTYRASDGAPSDKAEMLNEYCASQSMPSEAFIHPIECDPKENPFNVHYVRNTAPPAGEPLMSYDLGRTFVATQGQLTDGAVLGDLWVTYEVELKKPVIRSGVIQTDLTQYHFAGTISTMGQIYTGTKTVQGNDKYGFGAAAVQIPARTGKKFVITTGLFGASFSAFSKSLEPVVTNCTIVPYMLNGQSVEFVNVLSGSARTMWAVEVIVDDPTRPAVVDFTMTFAATGTIGNTCDCTIIQVE